MSRQHIFKQVQHIIQEVLSVMSIHIEVADIGWETSLINDLGADSFGFAQIVLNLEEAFAIDLSCEEIFKIGQTPGDLVSVIEKNGCDRSPQAENGEI